MSLSNERPRVKKLHRLHIEFFKRKAKKCNTKMPVMGRNNPPTMTNSKKSHKSNVNDALSTAAPRNSARIFYIGSKLSKFSDEKTPSKINSVPTEEQIKRL